MPGTTRGMIGVLVRVVKSCSCLEDYVVVCCSASTMEMMIQTMIKIKVP